MSSSSQQAACVLELSAKGNERMLVMDWKFQFEMQDKGPNELQALEEAVQRMARLVLEIGPTGKVDGHAQRLLNVSNMPFSINLSFVPVSGILKGPAVSLKL